MGEGAAGCDDPAAWWRRAAASLSPAYSRYSDLVVESARGSHLHTVDGRDLLDFGCGIGVTNLGHLHPDVVRAVHNQVDRLWHTSVTALNQPVVEAAEALAGIAPPGLDRVFLGNSGAEAVEAAIKLARRATGRSEIIGFRGGFHGRTYGALTLTASRARYRTSMGPFLPGVHHVRYPNCRYDCDHRSGADCPVARGAEIEQLFATTVPPESVAAIVVEPLQGEGGFVVPPPTFLPSLRRLCDEHGILLVCDEVQTGFGRTGRFFAVEHSGVRPDIMCVAKGFGNGLPIAAIVATEAVMSCWQPGEHGSTYGGNAVACAAAAAVVEVLRRDRLPERAQRLGDRVQERLGQWPAHHLGLDEARGLGLMIGLEFRRDGQPAAAIAHAVQQRCIDDGLLVLTCGVHDNVVRLLPPLTIEEGDLDRGLDILEAAVAAEAGG